MREPQNESGWQKKKDAYVCVCVYLKVEVDADYCPVREQNEKYGIRSWETGL